MEADSKKLRLGGFGCGDADADADDDEKVNKFFALIRSFREARDRSASEIGEAKPEENKKKKQQKIGALSKESPTRTPSFRCEDFAQVAECRSASPRPMSLPPDSSAIGNRKRKEKAAEEQQVLEGHRRLIQHARGLDLNLSLCCAGHDFSEP